MRTQASDSQRSAHVVIMCSVPESLLARCVPYLADGVRFSYALTHHRTHTRLHAYLELDDDTVHVEDLYHKVHTSGRGLAPVCRSGGVEGMVVKDQSEAKRGDSVRVTSVPRSGQ
jgi:hypothetical protein